jgi:choline/ethanolamine kinase
MDGTENHQNINLTLDLSKLREMHRGITPVNIRQTCFQLCNDFLFGDWNKISAESMEFKRISGGLTNQIFYCALPDQLKSRENEPNQVLIKFYESKHTTIKSEGSEQKDERFNDNIISLITARYGLGPKIFGIFNGGIIMEFINVFIQ